MFVWNNWEPAYVCLYVLLLQPPGSCSANAFISSIFFLLHFICFIFVHTTPSTFIIVCRRLRHFCCRLATHQHARTHTHAQPTQERATFPLEWMQFFSFVWHTSKYDSGQFYFWFFFWWEMVFGAIPINFIDGFCPHWHMENGIIMIILLGWIEGTISLLFFVCCMCVHRDYDME